MIKYSTKAFESLKYFKPVHYLLSTSNRFFALFWSLEYKKSLSIYV